jgi:hypothetical protein
MSARNSNTFGRYIALAPNKRSIDRAMDALKLLPREIGNKVVQSASKRWGRETARVLKALAPKGDQTQTRLSRSMIAVTKINKKRGAFRVSVRVGAEYDASATRRTGGAGWRLLFIEEGRRAWPKGRKAPIPGRGRAWRKGIRNAFGAKSIARPFVRMTSATASQRWVDLVVADVESIVKEKSNNG